MLEGLNSAASGMAAQQQRLDSVANDLANANTTGYKHGRVGFRDLMYEQAGRPAAAGVQTGHGAAAVDAGKSFGQGALQRTDRSLDIAIQGEGFLRVKLADGREALTRDGNLLVDGRGRLATNTGALIQPGITRPQGRPPRTRSRSPVTERVTAERPPAREARARRPSAPRSS